MTGTILEGEEFPCAFCKGTGVAPKTPLGGVPYAVATCRARGVRGRA